jgi:predicted transcriptional regulator
MTGFITEKQAKDSIRLYPHLAVDMKLSEQALNVYLVLRVRDNETASSVSKRFGISIPHANRILQQLVKKHYVTRTKSPQESGGYEFIYQTEITTSSEISR